MNNFNSSGGIGSSDWISLSFVPKKDLALLIAPGPSTALPLSSPLLPASPFPPFLLSLPSLLLLDPKTRPRPHSWKDQRQTSSLPGLQSHSDKKSESVLQPKALHDPPCLPLLSSPSHFPLACYASVIWGTSTPLKHTHTHSQLPLPATVLPQTAMWLAPHPSGSNITSSERPSLITLLSV